MTRDLASDDTAVVCPSRLHGSGVTAGLSSSAEDTVGKANRGTRITNLDRPLARWPDPWRVAVIALATLILCSCRGPAQRACDVSPMPGPQQAGLPSRAYAAAQPVDGSWSPPGIARPWPRDEYLRDGGDEGLPAKVIGTQWEVCGLEPADTVAHFDTLDGRTIIEPSNKVHIYSPRFGAVRKIDSLVSNDGFERVDGLHLPTVIAGPSSTQLVTSSKQNQQADRQIGSRSAGIYRTRWGDGIMATTNKPREYEQDMFMPYENVKVIREGIIDAAEMAHLAAATTAAVVWTADQAVQVILDRQAAMSATADEKLQSVYVAKAPPGDPKLRVIKVADKQDAQPGEEVAFTIRFDNIGNQLIGNVTIIDNLTTRLEFVPDSGQCSVDAQFFTEPNEGDSLVVRCEITDPLEPGEGGVIRFRCVVR